MKQEKILITPEKLDRLKSIIFTSNSKKNIQVLDKHKRENTPQKVSVGIIKTSNNDIV